MNCTRLQQVLDAHIDGELDRATTGEITAHLAQCVACAALRDERRALRLALRAHAPYFTAPAARVFTGASASTSANRKAGASAAGAVK